MKRWLIVCLAVVCVVSQMAWGQEAANPVPVQKKFAVIGVGDVSDADVDAVRQYIQFNTFFYADMLPHKELVGGGLDGEAKAAAKEMKPEHVLLVALVNPTEDITVHGVMVPEVHAAAVNVKALKSDEERIYRRRLGKETLRSIAYLMGMETCPNPQCCLSEYANLKELDMTGGNFCPPCLFKLQELCKGADMALIEDMSVFEGPAAAPAPAVPEAAPAVAPVAPEATPAAEPTPAAPAEETKAQ